MVACRYRISLLAHSSAIELNTRRDIPDLRAPMNYSLNTGSNYEQVALKNVQIQLQIRTKIIKEIQPLENDQIICNRKTTNGFL